MSLDLIAIIQNLVAAKPFQPFRVKTSSGDTRNIEEAWHYQNLVEGGVIDPKQITDIYLIPKLNTYYNYDEYERARRAAASDPEVYNELLQAPEWEEKREEVFDERGRECEECGSTKNLENHHTYYVLDGRDPWDYPVNDFRVLCRKCHKERHA